jgi:hypothetical protein
MRITNILLFMIAALLAVNLLRVPSVRAASTKVRVQIVPKSGSLDVDGEIVGFSCVNKGAYTECSVASR